MSARLRVSIIIPVFNDAEALPACLRAIAAQTKQPYEVIVVDNNSTDASLYVASTFPFVTILRESKQGVIHARTRGFNAARGDIIGRIDADSIIADNWVETIQKKFNDPAVHAVSGSVEYYAVAGKGFLSKADLLLRRYLANVLGKNYTLQGANMAVRRSVWLSVRSRLCSSASLHEDFDLSAHLVEAGFTNHFEPALQAGVALRQAGSTWLAFSTYIALCPLTYARHRRQGFLHLACVAAVVIACYPVLHILYVGYDAVNDSFTFSKLFRNDSVRRVNPATFVE